MGPADFGVDRFTVPAVLDRRAEQYPDRVMMSVAGLDITFEQMRQRSCAAANLLVERGIGPGDCVALFTATCPEWIYFWLGAARIGAVSAAVNAANKGDFLLHNIALSQAKVILTDAERRPRIDEISGQLGRVTDIVVQGDSLTAELNSAATVTDNPTAAGDVGVLFFTSGTTGPSKAVATSWDYLFSVAATVAAAWDFTAGEALWTAMPLFHLSAAPSVLAPMLVGGTTVLAATFHPREVWDEVREHRAVGFVGAGAMVSMLQSLPPDPRDAQLPLRFISAAPIDADAYRAIEQRYGCRIVTMYGMTEAFPARGEWRCRRGCSRNLGPSELEFRGAHRRRRRCRAAGRIGGGDHLPAQIPASDEPGVRARGRATRACRWTRIRNGSAPATWAGSTRARTSRTWIGSRTRCVVAVRTCRRWKWRPW